MKKTLGVCDDEVEKAISENIENEENRLEKKRALEAPYDKKASSKAFATLGFDIYNFLYLYLLLYVITRF